MSDKKFTLETAANFVKGKNTPRAFQRLVQRVREIFSFSQERSNRLRRFLKVVGAYKRGALVNDIVREYGCSRNTVQRYARLAGLPIRPKGFDPDIRRGVIAMYRLKKPIAQIAAHFGVSEAYVSKTATEEGINRRNFKRAT